MTEAELTEIEQAWKVTTRGVLTADDMSRILFQVQLYIGPLTQEIRRAWAERDALRDENTRWREAIAALAVVRDDWQRRALSAERVAVVPDVVKR
jgi:hypothetical protein